MAAAEPIKNPLNYATGALERAAQVHDADGPNAEREIELAKAAALLAVAHQLHHLRVGIGRTI